MHWPIHTPMGKRFAYLALALAFVLFLGLVVTNLFEYLWKEIPAFWGKALILTSFSSIAITSLLSLLFNSDNARIKNKIILMFIATGLFIAQYMLLFVIPQIPFATPLNVFFVLSIFTSISFYKLGRQEQTLTPFALHLVVVTIPLALFLLIGFFNCSYGSDFSCIEDKAIQNNDISYCDAFEGNALTSCICGIAPTIDRRDLCTYCYSYQEGYGYSENTANSRITRCFLGTTKTLETDQAFMTSLYQYITDSSGGQELLSLQWFYDCYQSTSGQYDAVKQCLLAIDRGNGFNAWPTLWDLGNYHEEFVACQDSGSFREVEACMDAIEPDINSIHFG